MSGDNLTGPVVRFVAFEGEFCRGGTRGGKHVVDVWNGTEGRRLTFTKNLPRELRARMYEHCRIVLEFDRPHIASVDGERFVYDVAGNPLGVLAPPKSDLTESGMSELIALRRAESELRESRRAAKRAIDFMFACARGGMSPSLATEKAERLIAENGEWAEEIRAVAEYTRAFDAVVNQNHELTEAARTAHADCWPLPKTVDMERALGFVHAALDGTALDKAEVAKLSDSPRGIVERAVAKHAESEEHRKAAHLPRCFVDAVVLAAKGEVSPQASVIASAYGPDVRDAFKSIVENGSKVALLVEAVTKCPKGDGSILGTTAFQSRFPEEIRQSFRKITWQTNDLKRETDRADRAEKAHAEYQGAMNLIRAVLKLSFSKASVERTIAGIPDHLRYIAQDALDARLENDAQRETIANLRDVIAVTRNYLDPIVEELRAWREPQGYSGLHAIVDRMGAAVRQLTSEGK